MVLPWLGGPHVPACLSAHAGDGLRARPVAAVAAPRPLLHVSAGAARLLPCRDGRARPALRTHGPSAQLPHQ